MEKTPREIFWWKKVILNAIVVCLAFFLGALGGFYLNRMSLFGF